MKCCSVENCESKHYGLGYCMNHYKKFKRDGHLEPHVKYTPNELIDKDTYYELVLTDKKGNKVGKTKIDKEDLVKVQSVGRWCINDKGYVLNTKNNVITYLHRLIVDASIDDYVDHKKTGMKNKRDNRKKNLRIATNAQNQYNTGLSKTNTSGYKGVYWNKDRGVWVAMIRTGGKKLYLGSFTCLKEAGKAYRDYAKLYHKEFYNASGNGGGNNTVVAKG